MNTRAMVVLGAVLLAALTRLLPHPWNFAPMTAIALFSAATLADRRLALLTPLLALFISDLGIEAMHRLGLMPTWGLYSGMWVVYLATMLIAVMGFALRGRRNVPMIAGMTLAGSVVFFIVTNFGVWAYGDIYPHTVKGLAACYVAGIPFFRSSLLGDVVYATVLFGCFALAERWLPVARSQPALAVPAPEEA